MKPYPLLLSLFIFSCDNPEEPDTTPPTVTITFSTDDNVSEIVSITCISTDNEGIKNGRFHDLRRTFGLNLIKQGRTIYEVSKLLGHSSVRTTEKHYAPLLVSEISDFKL